MKIHVHAADTEFSRCVRERVNWTCERCQTYYPEGARGGLDCSHYHSRRHQSTRYDPNNAFAHCVGCHAYLGANPEAFHRWALGELGQGMLDILYEKHNMICKRPKTERKAIAKHYREEFKRMRGQRAAGVTGRLEFESYD